METYTLRCPHCGADLDDSDGLETFFCRYCGTKIILEGRNPKIVDAKIRDFDSKIKSREKNEDIEREFIRKEKELEHRKKEDKYQEQRENEAFKSLFKIAIILIVVSSLMLGIFELLEKRQDPKLEQIYREIVQLKNEERYDEALLKLPELTGGTKNWEDTRDKLELEIKQDRIDHMENKYVTINKSAYDFDRMNYKEVVSYLENLGFIYIDTFATSRSGHFFINENEITEISIDGNSKFLKDEQFPLDARITITYYTKSKYLYQLTTMVPGFLHSHLC